MPNVMRGIGISETILSAYGTQGRRKDYPDDNFLLVDKDGNRKFPYRDPETGAIHLQLLRSSIKQAIMFHYKDVEDKATDLYAKHCAEKDKELEFKIIKEEFQGIILGIVASPDEPPDQAGHTLTKEAIQEMCWEYNKNFAILKYRHGMGLTKDEAVILESYIAPCALELEGKKVKEGAWLQRIQLLSDELKSQVKSGILKGLSLGGYIIDSKMTD